MPAEARTVEVEPGSELARLLEEAAETPLRFEQNGVRFRLAREADDIWTGYDPERARQSTIAGAGSWNGIVDAEAFKAYIRERRRTKNRPSVRW